ncbi:uncharacterized protein DUF4240 [Stackebrandtia albiflava]|uniref:Uncharacterized protein DUF4240 n=1 Tax=Stackebrandtia albiflava TaxID=406432 RepID=A0A562VGH8_9ACTN|nr:DUF4240 domain-containing protein [Stackebrandtia albiflava]TWJ16914.1 uncharacterized protein DUF4240 [Stackebrandtia albiflava]
MDENGFWDLIEAAHGDPGTYEEALTARLAGSPPERITAFGWWFDVVDAAAYRWDLWAAAYLVGGGCSDDSFMDFRAGVIALGRDWYGRVLAAPDSLADHPEVAKGWDGGGEDLLFREEVRYAAARAYERRTGGDDFYEADRRYAAARPAVSKTLVLGEDFDFDDDAEMRRRMPRLSALFL